MSSEDIAIKVDGLSKVFQVYEKPVHRLMQIFAPRVHRFVPGALGERWMAHRYYREFWALRDIGFEVRKGDALGIVGRNGSGKSTLLQILAGTLAPTIGSVDVRGRIAALLELGSGFNPDFTGRENVLLNGLILGLTEREIQARFDDIAAFADIGEFIDQPVKTYSSGMMLRLAFAVQTQVKPDILIVDEALAVGDALFQKRCFQQMEKLRNEGTTLLFVSHDQESVRTLTSHALLLRDGEMKAYGPSSEVVLEYRRQLHDDESAYYRRYTEQAVTRAAMPAKEEKRDAEAETSSRSERMSFGDRECEVMEVEVLNADGQPCGLFYPGDQVVIRTRVGIKQDITHLNVNLRLRNKEGVKMYSWGTLNQDIAIWAGRGEEKPFWERSFRGGEEIVVEFSFDCRLGMNFYEVQVAVSEEQDRYYGAQRMLHWRDEAAFFQVGVKPREYHFGGVCDLRMRAQLLTN